MLRRVARIGLLLCAAVIAAAATAHAASPLGVGSAEPAFGTSGFLGGFLAWVNGHQQSFYRALTGALRTLREDPSGMWMLLGLSFGYGVFHAAGPGHGKAVISSYMLANETELRRGIAIAFISSLLQGLVALLAVGAAYFLLRGSPITLTRATNAMEIASYALVAGFGGWMLVRKLRNVRFSRTTTEALFAGAGSSAMQPSALRFQDNRTDHPYRAGRSARVCSECGMAHLPDPARLASPRFGAREAWSAILAVGLRPCSGAILVLTFSLLNGLYIGGVLSVLAMSLGTAITVSALAVVAVGAKDLAMRLAGAGSSAAGRIGFAIEVLGALMVLVLGLILLGAALQP